MSAALGLSQLAKLPRFATRRRALAALYDAALAPLAPLVGPAPIPADGQRPCLHLYAVLIDFEAAGVSRGNLMRRLAERGIGTQVHYIPVNRQPLFRARGAVQHLPGAEAYYARCLALPLFPAMTDADVERVVEALTGALERRA
jgi:dTDP-4-amino-4,6-dideoxygalactose transaminase